MTRPHIDEARIAPHTHEVVAHCRLTDIFMVGDDTPADFVDDANAYLADFATPVKSDGALLCLHCEKPIDGFKQMFGTGVAIEWGLAHGEGRCSGCGWPYRGMHHPKNRNGEELFSLRNLFLAYHPEQVSA